jgi:hypothetical protein
MGPSRAITALVAACVFASASPASAQQAIFDSAQVERVNGSECHQYARYTVVARERNEEVGSDVFVRSSPHASCAADSLPGDYVFRNEWAEYFAGLRGDYLILDSGTGPDLRGLIVIDLASRRRVFEGGYVDLAPAPTPDALGVWQGYELAQPARGCTPPTGGLLPGVDSLVWLNLRTGKTRFAGQVRCAQRQ